MRLCIPFYRGFLYIEEVDGYIVRISYKTSCEAPIDYSHKVAKLLRMYEEGYPIDFSRVPVRFPTGSEFDRKVWNIIRAIPYGSVKSYKWVAEKLGGARYSRAVGNSLSRNPILIIVPCHRIIRSNGYMGGFGEDIRLKRYLLELEGHLIKGDKIVSLLDGSMV